VDQRTGNAKIFLGRNKDGKNYIVDKIGNIEGFIVFSGSYFAARANPLGETSFRLLLNGSFAGESFSFEPGEKDYNGLFFAKSGKAYLRVYSHGRWLALENGKQILSDVFQHVWLVKKASDGSAVIYGTK
jgi:hypothetical protein